MRFDKKNEIAYIWNIFFTASKLRKEGESCGHCFGICQDYCTPIPSNYTGHRKYNCGNCEEGLECSYSVTLLPGAGTCVKIREQKERSLLPWTPPALCNLNQKTGCEAAFPRFFFNKKTGKCEKFVYGGCGGNKNNFKTKISCEITCGVIRGFSGWDLIAENIFCLQWSFHFTM